MSIYAAIGYAVGVIVFALLMRLFRQRLIQHHIEKAEASKRRANEEKLR